MTDFLEICQQAARAGGEILLDFRGRITPQTKGPKDFVTEADFASQSKIRQMLLDAFPDHTFLGEEEASDSKSVGPSGSLNSAEYCWVVDPLDGTMNYVHGLPNYSVSIALCHRGKVIVGTVLDPVLNECFSAQRGCGATCNGQPIQTSDCQRIEEGLIAASLAAQLPPNSPEISRFMEVMHHAQAIRRLGSAALNLCYVAAGRMDGYWATCVKAWDMAAGQLILQEAGGTITGMDGADVDFDHPQFVAAATPSLQKQLRSVLDGAVLANAGRERED